MAVSLPSFCSAVKLKPCLKLSTVNQGAVEARAQRFRDEGILTKILFNFCMQILDNKVDPLYYLITNI